MKYLFILLLASCTPMEPVIDLKVSDHPEDYYVDWQQCEWMMEKFDLSEDSLIKCLDGRGYSTIGIKGDD